MKVRVLLTAAVVFLCAAGATANAETRKAGDSLNYEFSVVQKTLLPPTMQAALARLMGGFASKPQTFTINVAIDRVDANGNAHAKIATHFAKQSGPPGMSLGSDASFEGSVLPDGQIVPTFDAGAILAASQSASTRAAKQVSTPSPEQQTNKAAYSLWEALSFFNDVALGAGKRTLFKDGDAWRVIIADKGNETINFSNTGKQSYRGHDVVALAVTAVQMTPQGSRRTKGTAYYDPQQHVLVGLQSETVQDISQLQMTKTIDINLQQ
jgi:hypothetical protein